MRLRFLSVECCAWWSAANDDDGENSKDDRKKKLFARQKSRRISVSTRNLNRMHTDFHDDQDRLNEEKEVLKQKQRAEMQLDNC